jgi:hypothetical protein
MLSRRSLIGKLAAGAAVSVACAAGVARASTGAVRRETDTPTGSGHDGLAPAPDAIAVPPPAPISAPPPWELLRPLALGAVVAHGWRVAELSEVMDGACVLTLRNERGRSQRIHLCRNDGRPQGLVYTDRLDLVVMNGGQGELPTEEGLAQAVAAVAHVLAGNERGWQPAHPAVALLPHAARLRQFAASADWRLR